MNQGACVVCGDDLPPWSRADRRTCSSRCRVARHRAAQTAPPDPVVVTVGSPAATRPAVNLAVSSPGTPPKDPAAVGTAVIRLSSWLADVSAEAIGNRRSDC